MENNTNISRHGLEHKHIKGCMLINKTLGTKKCQACCFAFHNSGLNFVRFLSYSEFVSNNYALQQAIERMSLVLFLITHVYSEEERLGNVFLVIFSI